MFGRSRQHSKFPSRQYQTSRSNTGQSPANTAEPSGFASLISAYGYCRQSLSNTYPDLHFHLESGPGIVAP